MNKIIVAIIIAVILVGGYFLFKGSYQSPSAPRTSNQPPVPQPSASQAPAAEKNEEYAVTYTDSGYSPNTLTIKVGETVTWKNVSSKSMWTASAIHPTHRLYPKTGGCIGSTFDACKGIQPGSSWSFKFDIAGAWKYHNHLSPGDTGTIQVR